MVRHITTQSRPEFYGSIQVPQDLPISNHVDDLQKAIQLHQVVIVVGETGSGKTTQLPKICLRQGRGRAGVIVHTQPRRLAAKGISQRLQSELGHPETVGLKIRFDDKTSDANYIQVMTDGLLLQLFARDPLLRWCDTLIIDEAHERSLNIDFLLGLIKQLLHKRPEFRLIVTSATIKHHLFADFFQDAPVFTISGRTYPVDILYLGPDHWGHHHQDSQISGVIQAISQLYQIDANQEHTRPPRSGALDALVFLAGERQIHDTAQGLKKAFGDAFEILPLYARLASSDQSKVFHPGRRTRIVLCTNLAETSITVPRIGFVIDAGQVRISRYSHRRKVQLLPIEPISRASAAQRAGRCGRIAAGTCVRLYDEQDFLARPEYPEAEIHRTHLAGVILQMKAMRLGDPAQFSFIEPPAQKMINDGYQLLEELGAVEARGLTSLGREMSRLPVDPRTARLITAAGDSLYEILIIASALSVMDVVDAKRDQRDQVQQRHGPFQSKNSEFVSMVVLWHRLEWFRRHLTRKEFQKFCEKNFISIARFYEWRDVHKQLKLLAVNNKARPHKRPTEQSSPVNQKNLNGSEQRGTPRTPWAQYLHKQLDNGDLKEPYADWAEHFSPGCNMRLHKPVVAAFATQIAVEDSESSGFLSCRQRVCYVHPSSRVRIQRKTLSKSNKQTGAAAKNSQAKNQIKSKAQWIVIAEFLETQKLWANKIAKIDIQWVLPVVQHLLKYSYSEPVWSKKMGAVTAKRTSTLFGLVVQRNEQVIFTKIDRSLCRDIFIQSALVEQSLGESRSDPGLIDFFAINNALIARVEDMEAKARTSGLMASDQEIYEFYDSVVPSHITDRITFFSWWKKHRVQSPETLHFKESWFIKNNQSLSEFPSELSINGQPFKLEYQFDPGQRYDGVTIIVPEIQLYQLNACELDWLVPGLLKEKCEALIRGLPKLIRKKFVPVPQFVENFIHAGYETQEPLILCLEDFLYKVTGFKTEPLSWPELQGHLCMNIRVIDQQGNTIVEHNQLEEIRLSRQQEVLQHTATDVHRAKSAKNHELNTNKNVNKDGNKVNKNNIQRVNTVAKVSHNKSQRPQAEALNQTANKSASVQPVSQLSEMPDMLAAQPEQSPIMYTTLSPPHDGQLYVTATPDLIQAEHLYYHGLHHLLSKQTNASVKQFKRQVLKEPSIRRMVLGMKTPNTPLLHHALQTDQEKLDYFWVSLMKATCEAVFMTAELPKNGASAKRFFEARAELVPFLEKHLAAVLKLASLYPALSSKANFVRQEQQSLSSHPQADADIFEQFTTLFSFSWLDQPCAHSLSTWLPLVQVLDHRLEKRVQRATRDEVDAKQILAWQTRLEAMSELCTRKPLHIYRTWTQLRWGLQAVRAAIFAQHMKISPKYSAKKFAEDLAKLEIDVRKN